MAIINGIDQESIRSIAGVESEVKLPSKEVVRLSRPVSIALQYDGSGYSGLKENGVAKSVDAGWIYPVYVSRPSKVASGIVKTGEVTDPNRRRFEFYWIDGEVSFGGGSNAKGYNSFERFKVEKAAVTGYAVQFDASVDRLVAGGADVTKSTPSGYFYPAYLQDSGGLTELTLQSNSLRGTFTLWIDLSSVTTGGRNDGGYQVFSG